MIVSIIVAMTEDRVIGKDNALPWRLPEDLKRFKKITMGSPLVMGRKTFESIGRPLPGRASIVLTRDPAWSSLGARTAGDLESALKLARESGAAEVFVIGGASVFAAALPSSDRIYLTLIHKTFAGDVRFPEYDLNRGFKVVERASWKSAGLEAIPCTFITAERAGAISQPRG